MLLAHISDLHLTDGTRVQADADPRANAEAALEAAMDLGADALIITGDLANDGGGDDGPGAYRSLATMLAAYPIPTWLVPGNHDNPVRMAELVGGPPKGDTGHHDALVTFGDLTIVLLDSSRPGRIDGSLAPGQLEWLESTLADLDGRPSIVALHHPPFTSGIPHLDRVGLDVDGRAGLGSVLARQRATRLLCGHAHRHMVSDFAGIVAVGAPSSAFSFALHLSGGDVNVVASAPEVVAHHITDTGIVSHRVSTADPGPVPYRKHTHRDLQ